MKTLFDELKLLSTVNFRELYQKYIYIHCRKLLDEIFPGEIEDTITGVVAYCYIDSAEGISFRPFMLAAMTEESLQVFTMPHIEDTIYVLRLRDGRAKMSELHDAGHHMYLYAVDPEKYMFFNLSIVNFDTESFQDIKEEIDRAYDAGENKEELRTEGYSGLDKYRHPWYPDDVQVLLYDKEKGGEKVWVRLEVATGENCYLGELLNEPYQDYGCHTGMLIEFTEIGTGEDALLVFTGRTAVRK